MLKGRPLKDRFIEELQKLGDSAVNENENMRGRGHSIKGDILLTK
jgi:hypothetical protein